MIQTICNGIYCDRNTYGTARVEELKPVIESVRNSLREEYPSASDEMMLFCGSRFEDDKTVIATMESVQDQEKLFEKGTRSAVRDALINCMSRDYYYMFEKDYGNADEYYTDDDVDEE